MPELERHSILVDRYTWAEVIYQAVRKGRRGTRITAGEMLREEAARRARKRGA